MDRNVNTTLSNDNMGFSIRWVNFESVENEIDAKKMVVNGKGKLPKCSKVENTYMVKSNGVWERCVKAANKLRRIAGATIKDEQKAQKFDKRLERKYNLEVSPEEKRKNIQVSTKNKISTKSDDRDAI